LHLYVFKSRETVVVCCFAIVDCGFVEKKLVVRTIQSIQTKSMFIDP